MRFPLANISIRCGIYSIVLLTVCRGIDSKVSFISFEYQSKFSKTMFLLKASAESAIC